ncbi:MAG: ParA family protein [Thermococci archaeon]|nr:ParA family protein [Thermococci archaeon]
MTVIISVANQKGGVGKTTVALNLSYGLARRGRRVLAVDVDPQFNLTFGLIGMKVLDYENSNVGSLMTGEIRADEARAVVSKNLHLIPSHLNLSMKELDILNGYNRERKLHRALTPLLPDYDYVIIDTPPSMGIFLINALTASDYVVIPLELSYFGIIGMQLMFNLMEMIREETNENLRLLGLIPNKFTRQTTVPKTRLKELKEMYPNAPLLTTIPKAIALERAQALGRSIYDYGDARASKAFLRLTDQIISLVES